MELVFRIVQIARAACYFAVAAAFLAIGVAAWSYRSVPARIDATLEAADRAIAESRTEMISAQADLDLLTIGAQRLLEQGQATVAAARPVMGDAEIVLGETQQAVRGIKVEAIGTMDAATGTLDVARSAIAEVDAKNGVLKQSYAAVHDLRLTLDNINKGAIDERQYMETTLPGITAQVQANLASSNDLLVKASDATAQADGILADGKFEADRFAHPPPKHWYVKVWDGTKDVGILVYDFIR